MNYSDGFSARASGSVGPGGSGKGGIDCIAMVGRMRMLLEVENVDAVEIGFSEGMKVSRIFGSDQRDRALRSAYCSPSRIRDAKWRRRKGSGLFVIEAPNGVVNTGLNNMLDRWFGLSGPPAAIGFIGVSSNNTAVTATTVNLNGASGGTAANTIIKAISPAASRTNQTTTGGATFANADFTSGVFVINKVGFLITSTDAGTGLIDVIGGSGGADPFSRTFVVDFTSAGTFTLVPQIALSAIAVKGSFPSPL